MPPLASSPAFTILTRTYPPACANDGFTGRTNASRPIAAKQVAIGRVKAFCPSGFWTSSAMTSMVTPHQRSFFGNGSRAAAREPALLPKLALIRSRML